MQVPEAMTSTPFPASVRAVFLCLTLSHCL